MSPFSPAPCPLRSHRPQLSGREHSAPTLLNQRFSGIWCHSTPPPPSCQGEKSSSLALAARWGGTGRHCLQERRAALQGPGGAQAAAPVRPCAKAPHKGRKAGLRVSSPSPSPTAQIAPGWAWRGKGEEKAATCPSLCAGSGEKLPRAPQGPTRAGLQLDGAGKVFSTKRLSTVGRWDEAAKRKTTLRPPRRIGTAPLPPRPDPMRPEGTYNRRCGGVDFPVRCWIYEGCGTVSSFPGMLTPSDTQ